MFWLVIIRLEQPKNFDAVNNSGPIIMPAPSSFRPHHHPGRDLHHGLGPWRAAPAWLAGEAARLLSPLVPQLRPMPSCSLLFTRAGCSSGCSSATYHIRSLLFISACCSTWSRPLRSLLLAVHLILVLRASSSSKFSSSSTFNSSSTFSSSSTFTSSITFSSSSTFQYI